MASLSSPITHFSASPANPITQHVFPSSPWSTPPPFFLTLLLLSFSSVWEGIAFKNTLFPCPALVSVPLLLPFPGSAVDVCSSAASVPSPEPPCRCLWRRQSWQREGSKMLGWNLGHVGSSPERGMVEDLQDHHIPQVKMGITMKYCTDSLKNNFWLLIEDFCGDIITNMWPFKSSVAMQFFPKLDHLPLVCNAVAHSWTCEHRAVTQWICKKSVYFKFHARSHTRSVKHNPLPKLPTEEPHQQATCTVI